MTSNSEVAAVANLFAGRNPNVGQSRSLFILVFHHLRYLRYLRSPLIIVIFRQFTLQQSNDPRVSQLTGPLHRLISGTNHQHTCLAAGKLAAPAGNIMDVWFCMMYNWDIEQLYVITCDNCWVSMFVYCFGTWKNHGKTSIRCWRGKIALQRIPGGKCGTLANVPTHGVPNPCYHLVMTNIAVGKSPFLIGKPSIKGAFSMAMLNNQRVSFARTRTLRIKFRFEPPASDHCSGVQSLQDKVMAANWRASDVTFCRSQAATVMSLLPSWYMRP